MSTRAHMSLLLQAIAVWAGFWLLGWPRYYQQYSTELVAVASILLSVAISLAAVFILARTRPEIRASRAFWIALYYTLPFAALDTWYCGIHLGLGAAYLVDYWYLTIFYVTPWLTFPPTARLLQARQRNGG